MNDEMDPAYTKLDIAKDNKSSNYQTNLLQLIQIINASLDKKHKEFQVTFLNILVFNASFRFLNDKEDELNDYDSCYNYYSFEYLVKAVERLFEVNKRKCLFHFYRKILVYDRFLVIKYNKKFRYVYKHLSLRNVYLRYIGFNCFVYLILFLFIKRWYLIMKRDGMNKGNSIQIKLKHVIHKTIIRNNKVNVFVNLIKRSIVNKIIYNDRNRLLKLYNGVNILYAVVSKAKITKMNKRTFTSVFVSNSFRNNIDILSYLIILEIANYTSITFSMLQRMHDEIINDLFTKVKTDKHKDNCVKLITNESLKHFILMKTTIKHLIPSYRFNLLLFHSYKKWLFICLNSKLKQCKNIVMFLRLKNTRAKLYLFYSIIKNRIVYWIYLMLYKTQGKRNNEKRLGFDLLLYLENRYNNILLNVISGLYKTTSLLYRKYYISRISPFTKMNKTHFGSFVIDIFHKWKYMNYSIYKDTNTRLVYHMFIRAIHDKHSICFMKYKMNLMNNIYHYCHYRNTFSKKIVLLINLLNNIIVAKQRKNNIELSYNKMNYYFKTFSQPSIMWNKNLIVNNELNKIDLLYVQFCFNKLKQSFQSVSRHMLLPSLVMKIYKFVNVIKRRLNISHVYLLYSFMSKLIRNEYQKRYMLLNKLITRLSFTFAPKRLSFSKWQNYVYYLRRNVKMETQTLIDNNIEIKKNLIYYIEGIELLCSKTNEICTNKTQCCKCSSKMNTLPQYEINQTLASIISEESFCLKPINNIKSKRKNKKDDILITQVLNENPINHNRNTSIRTAESKIRHYNDEEEDEIEYNVPYPFNKFTSSHYQQINISNTFDDYNTPVNFDNEYYSYLEHKESELKEKIISLNDIYEPEIELIQNEIDSLYEKINIMADSEYNSGI